jgi:hypothetical protein
MSKRRFYITTKCYSSNGHRSRQAAPGKCPHPDSAFKINVFETRGALANRLCLLQAAVTYSRAAAGYGS